MAQLTILHADLLKFHSDKLSGFLARHEGGAELDPLFRRLLGVWISHGAEAGSAAPDHSFNRAVINLVGAAPSCNIALAKGQIVPLN
jgi:hypothetical protein